MTLEDRVGELTEEVEAADASTAEAARERWSKLTKPPGSLGRLEELGARLSGMAGGCPPPVPESPAVVICAGDHGVLTRGVSPWPREVTAAMVENFCAGGAAVNAFAGTVGARVSVLDVGVASELERHPLLRGAKVRRGTNDLSEGPAMDREEAARAVLAGAGIVEELVESGGVDLLVTGDMGIGNTTPAACLISTFTGRPAREVTGRGTGIDDATLELKVGVVEKALDLHRPDPGDPLGTLAALGGFEHAALVGLILMGAAYGVPVVLDGVVSNSAALVARALAPSSIDYTIAGHLSAEPGARVVLEKLGLEPLLDLTMRLGEGTGGLLAVPLVQGAARALREMATMEEAGISLSGLSREAIENLKSPLATRVELHEEIGSTQERARELAREGAPHGTLVISKIQSGGRGRLGRRWGSPSGGLWLSLVLRPDISTKAAARTTQTAAVGVAKALRKLGVAAQIKWPNDLLVDGRKICGVLAESSVEGVPVAAKQVGPGAERSVGFIILGVGLNANVNPQDLGVPDREVATLRSELGHDMDLLKLLEALLSYLDFELGRMEDFGAILDDWRSLNCTLGKRVRVRRFGEVLEGAALDLGPEGELLLKTGDGVVELFEGEIEQLRRERT